MVSAGILASRLLGLVRQRVFGHYFGTSDAADAFNAAFRIPNVLQNLFGEGVLSASFIPVYARLLAEGKRDEATRVANAVIGLLSLITSVIVLAGVLATPVLIDLIAPGFSGAKREQTILLVRILFPGAGLLALSAWCLGVLNSHRRFFLSYAAPVIWNLAVITALIVAGPGRAQYPLAAIAAWASVAGSGLQFLLQLPVVVRLIGPVRPRLEAGYVHARTVIRNFVPVFVSRGVFQISAYVDTVLASLLPAGAVAGLAYAQTLSMLPVSLFGMAVSAAELPAMSSVTGSEEAVARGLAQRLGTGLRQIAFLVVPSAVAFLALGHVVAGVVYQSGEFTATVTLYVWGILAGSAVGLLAATMGRLYSSAFYALQDTRTPLRFAVLRVGLTIGLGYVFAFVVPGVLGIEARWGAAGLTASAGMAAWVEFHLLRRALNRRIGPTGVPGLFLARLWGAALAAAGLAWAVLSWTPVPYRLLLDLLVLAVYGGAYFGACHLLRIPEAASLVGRLRRRSG